MEFDPNNHIIKLCMEGMAMEEKGQPGAAAGIFRRAWNEATNDFEKFTAAYYVARHQENVAGKLKWLQTVLELAIKINDEAVKGAYPSLYSAIAQCYEDSGDAGNAKKILC